MKEVKNIWKPLEELREKMKKVAKNEGPTICHVCGGIGNVVDIEGNISACNHCGGYGMEN